MDEKRIPRMRTASNIVAEIRALDPATEVSEYWIRQIMHDGTVPVVRIGRKIMANLDDVLALLCSGTTTAAPEAPTVAGIRRVDAKRP